jgi:2-polyprenyl-6-methoxyphenol hydroxylase-like FAD-dependent oxidoreductase
VHPLAGQGLNLGLADADVLATVLAEARRTEPWRSPGDERLLRRYARERWWPTQAMAGVTDGLLKLFAQDQSPLRELRNRGMGLLDQLTPVKRWLSGRALDN